LFKDNVNEEMTSLQRNEREKDSHSQSEEIAHQSKKKRNKFRVKIRHITVTKPCTTKTSRMLTVLHGYLIFSEPCIIVITEE